MKWQTDDRTAHAATSYPLSIKRTEPALQANGHPFLPSNWERYFVQPASWPSMPFRSSPDQIIRQFQQKHYTQAVAMVVSWGEMWRQPDAIWGTRKLEHIERVLGECAISIRDSSSICQSWRTLTGVGDGQLGWTSVMASKVLHFLCRSLGFEQEPPVPIDGKVIRQRVWRVFVDSIPREQRPLSWNGHTFETYCRYMTAIRTWAQQRGWSTTDLETTIFEQFDQ